MFGAGALDLVEDAVQESFISALRRWPFHGVPEHPLAWLTRVACNKALDVVRRDASWRDRVGRVERELYHGFGTEAESGGAFGHELRDDQLVLMFACCPPELSLDAQVTLVLKTVCGLSVREIARAFLAEEAAVAQRLVRAKARLRSCNLRLPAANELGERLAAVLEGLYLMFNEGYQACAGEDLVRTDLCAEAVRLAELLADHPVTARAEVDALAALFCFSAARLPARSGAGGEVVLLDEQDRTLWDRRLIARGLHHFARSARGKVETGYHLQAEIASCHTTAPSLEQTDWPRVLGAYDRLLALAPSPVVALNRAVAVARVEGVEAALAALAPLEGAASLARYHPYDSTRGELELRAGRPAQARASFELARALVASEPLRVFLERKIADSGG